MISPQLRAAVAQAEQAPRLASGRPHVRHDRRPASRRVVAQRTRTTRTPSTNKGEPPKPDDDEADERQSHRQSDLERRDILSRLIFIAEAIEENDAGTAHAVALDAIDDLRGTS